MEYGLQVPKSTTKPKRERYRRPKGIVETTLTDLLIEIGRPTLDRGQLSFIAQHQHAGDTPVFYAGSLDILKRSAIAVVGAREVSENGAARARRIAKELAGADVTVVSGLAKGVDFNALSAAIAAGGITAAVIGTPIDQAYPAENKALQSDIAEEHLLLTPFPAGQKVWPSNFPKRNRVMAAITDGSVIIEASDTSGTLHQAAECERLGRWLFILKSVVDDKSLEWPARFLKYERAVVVEKTSDIVDILGQG